MLVLLHSALECNRAIKLTSSSKQSCHRSPAQRGPITHLVVMPPRTVQVVGAVNLKYLSLSCLHEQMVVERASEFVHKSRRKQSHTPFGRPNTRGARGLQIPQQERENHAAGKPRRWRRTTWQGHNQHPPRDELPKRGPRWSSCSLSGGSRAAAKKDEITAAHSAEPAELSGGSEGIYYRVHEARKPQRWSCSASGARVDSKRSTDSKRCDPST